MWRVTAESVVWQVEWLEQLNSVTVSELTWLQRQDRLSSLVLHTHTHTHTGDHALSLSVLTCFISSMPASLPFTSSPLSTPWLNYYVVELYCIKHGPSCSFHRYRKFSCVAVIVKKTAFFINNHQNSVNIVTGIQMTMEKFKHAVDTRSRKFYKFLFWSWDPFKILPLLLHIVLVPTTITTSTFNTSVISSGSIHYHHPHYENCTRCHEYAAGALCTVLSNYSLHPAKLWQQLEVHMKWSK